MNVGVTILRLSEGLDYSGILGDVDDAKPSDTRKNNEMEPPELKQSLSVGNAFR